MIRSAFFKLLPTLAIAANLSAGSTSDPFDWPQFLGPTRNGVYVGTNLATSWPEDGPPLKWRTKIGRGFSGPVVSDGRLIIFHRLDSGAIVDCLESQSGKPIWRYQYHTDYVDDFGFDEGPRSTPAIASGFVYTFGAEGTLTCLAMADGKLLWKVDTRSRFNASKGFFGAACSPLEEGQSVLLNIGGGKGLCVEARK